MRFSPPIVFDTTRGSPSRPATCSCPLPPLQTVVAVRFCPVVFERDDDNAGAAPEAGDRQGGTEGAAPAHPFCLPYKMVFAVGGLRPGPGGLGFRV